MDRTNYYFHGTGGYKGRFCAFDRISSIFNDGKISVNKNSGCVDGTISDGKKRIYLCDPSKPKMPNMLDSLSLYISTSPSLILEKNFDVITPIYSTDKGLVNQERTNLYDEVRTDSDIVLDNTLAGVTLPIELMFDEYQLLLQNNIVDNSHKRAFLMRLQFMLNALNSAQEYDPTLPVLDFLSGAEITLDIFDYLAAYISEGKISNKKLSLKKTSGCLSFY